MTDTQKGVLVGVLLMTALVLVGIFTDWGAGSEQPRVPIRELVQQRPTRPPHPATIYTPHGWERQ